MAPDSPAPPAPADAADRLREHFVPFPEQPTGRADAAAIAVERLDLILLFPFALYDPQEDAARGTGRLQGWVDRLFAATDADHPDAHAVWRTMDDRFPNPTGPNAPTEYAEWVFFHPFIRSFLYDSKNDREQAAAAGSAVRPPGKSVIILERLDTAGGRLTVEYGDRPAGKGQRVECLPATPPSHREDARAVHPGPGLEVLHHRRRAARGRRQEL